MGSIYQEIIQAKNNNQKLLGILLDPEKINTHNIKSLVNAIHTSPATHILVGGSTIQDISSHVKNIVNILKENTNLPILLFPANIFQVCAQADALLYLMLLSGRNPEYLIEQQIKAVPIIQQSKIEVISTGYILVDGGTETSTMKVTQTKPISQQDLTSIVQTAVAGEYIGNKIIYLEAGSGAKFRVSNTIIEHVASHVSIPILVGGGIKTSQDIDSAYKAGADMVIIGTAFENNTSFFHNLEV
ncbi:geranylgeranylglyceryl/heptaprenylglyceryl phosphate synthase [Flavobacterium croceum]|uniref:geranylgeranylglyceryl/heptaprenylglyceryl phosphate synthase n=1 Tax=Flavobacterium croceum TaxID=370975 RepID=UPI0024A90271|nr:geranylgeranylglyceryl/heptaprenylglyceryl phosphate synthase [Flavobacterium croceum]